MTTFNEEPDGIDWPVQAEPIVLTEVQKRNQDLADLINAETLANPKSVYAGKFVAILSGKIIAVTDTVEDCMAAFGGLDPENNCSFLLEVGRSFDDVLEVW